jgi:hypothetical protein
MLFLPWLYRYSWTGQPHWSSDANPHSSMQRPNHPDPRSHVHDRAVAVKYLRSHQAGNVPRATQVINSLVGWLESEVIQWRETRPRGPQAAEDGTVAGIP